MNFQFQPPAEGRDEAINQKDDFQEDRADKEVEEEQKSMDEESLEGNSPPIKEESQFEQSILFNKNNRRDRNINDAFIDKIEELEEEENRMMIVGKVDEMEWKAECLRLEKKFNELSTGAKEARKKHGFTNVETARVCSAVSIA